VERTRTVHRGRRWFPGCRAGRERGRERHPGHDKIDLFWAGQGGAVNTLWWTEADGWGLDHRTAFGLAGGGRWYPTLVTLADGRVLAAGGHPAFTDSRHWNNTPETWDPARDTWIIYGALGDLLALVQYPRMHVLPDGTVFCATPLVSEGQLGFSITYDPDTEESFQVAPLGDPDYLAPAIASSIDTTSALLPLRPSRNYAPSVLLCGGTTPLRSDLADNTPAWKAAGTRPLTGPRYNLNAVLLPSGEVFISGGVNDRTKDTTGVRTAEMYQPDSNTWDRLQDAQVVRNYHSVALLMPDGAVWTAGSNKNGEPSGPDHPTRELRIEVYRPWYFDQPRPQLVSAPARLERHARKLVAEQPCLGPHQIRGVKTLAKRSVNLIKLGAVLVGVLSQLVQVINTHAKFEFERFGFLVAGDLEALRQITLCLIQILPWSQVCFSEQAIYFSRVKAFGGLFVQPQLRPFQKIERLPITFIFYACVCQ